MAELIPKRGAYRELKSFQTARLVYDCTVAFCDKYIDKRSRTHDQMVQVARSGVQNIAEGSAAAGTSKKIEIKLTNVARASLEEFRRLLAKPEEWMDKSDKSDRSDLSDNFKERLRQERGANAVICLIRQATYLLSRQLEYLEKNFLKEGGFTERMYKMRSEQRKL